MDLSVSKTLLLWFPLYFISVTNNLSSGILLAEWIRPGLGNFLAYLRRYQYRISP